MEPIQRTSTLQRTTAAVRAALLSGEIALGDRLTEEALAAELGVARATLRTALHLLAQEGLIEQQPYRGWSAITLGAPDIWELYTLRAELEGFAVQTFIERQQAAPVGPLSKLRDVLEKACAKGDRVAASAADERLHRSVVQLAGHQRLLAQYDMMSAQIRMLIVSSNELILDLAELFEQHEPIFEVLTQGDAHRARQVIESHVRSEGEKLRRRVEEIERSRETSAS